MKDLFEQLNIRFACWQFRSSTKGRVDLWVNLADILDRGVPIINAVAELQRIRSETHGKYHPEAVVLKKWGADLANGTPLHKVIANWVSPEEVMMVNAGERGNLSESFQSIARVIEAKNEIRATVIGSIAYPILLLLAAFGVLYLFGVKVIPEISSMSIVTEWKGQAKMLVQLSGFIQKWFWIMLGTTIASVIAFFVSIHHFDGKVRVFLDRYPPYSIYRIMVGASWLIAYAAIRSANMKDIEALENLSKTAGPWLRRRLQAVLRGLKSGYDIGTSLLRTGYRFPDMEIINKLTISARYSSFEEALKKAGEKCIVSAQDEIRSRMRVVFIVLLLIVGGLAIFMASGVLDMQQQVAAAAQGMK